MIQKTITNEGEFIQITIPPGVYEIESLISEFERIIIDKGSYTEDEYPFTLKPKFSTLGSVIEISPQGTIIGFLYDDSIRNLLGFHETILYKKNLSPNRVDILSFDNIFFEINIVQGMVFKGERSGFSHNWTMTVDPGYKHVENFAGGISWYMMESKDFVSSISFKLKMEDNDLVSFNGQRITFRLSIKEI